MKHNKVSPSRQGKHWSKYRCTCFAPYASQCVCAMTERLGKRIYFKDLEARHLNGLFNVTSPDRILPPMGRDFQMAMFK